LAVEACLADLETAQCAFVFSTGLAVAVAAAILDLLESGAHIVAHDDLYGGVYRLLANLAPLTRWHSVTFVNLADSAAVEAATREDTKMLWFETPSNPLTRIVDSALLLRSLKTLAVRMERHCENAMKIATYLSENKKKFGLEQVWYPGLEDHPGHAIAKRQMHGYGAVISLIVKGGLPRADAIMKATHLFQFAVSLGGVESLIQHPASLTHATVRRKRGGLKSALLTIWCACRWASKG
jgi:cystathionine beta-lyase/cystathionine gamma-synthase